MRLDGYLSNYTIINSTVGHGTHVTGTTAGGVDRKIGVAPGAKWIHCRSMADPETTIESYLSCMQFFLSPTDL